MEYPIVFKDANEVQVVLNALQQRPHAEVRNVIDSIFKQATALEAEASAKASEEASAETKEESQVEEVDS